MSNLQDDDIYDIVTSSKDEKVVSFQALKQQFSAQNYKTNTPPPSEMAVNSQKPALPMKTGVPGVTLTDLSSVRSKLNAVPKRTSRVIIPDAFGGKDDSSANKLKPSIKPKPGVANATRLERKPTENTRPPFEIKKSKAISPKATPVVNELKTTETSVKVKSNKENLAPAVVSKTSIKRIDDTDKRELVTSCDGKTYRLLPLPESTGPAPPRPARHQDVTVPVHLYEDEADELYDEVGMVERKTYNVSKKGDRTVSLISEFTEEDEVGDSDPEDLYDTVDNLLNGATRQEEEIYDDDMIDHSFVDETEEFYEPLDEKPVRKPAAQTAQPYGTSVSSDIVPDEEEIYDEVGNTVL